MNSHRIGHLISLSLWISSLNLTKLFPLISKIIYLYAGSLSTAWSNIFMVRIFFKIDNVLSTYKISMKNRWSSMPDVMFCGVQREYRKISKNMSLKLILV